ncbi:MAG: hypothetical protein Q9160_009219 [Pyrenula sp. 1 TL-2023]
MAGIGEASAIFAVAQVGLSLAQTLVSVIGDYRSAAEQINSLKDELGKLAEQNCLSPFRGVEHTVQFRDRCKRIFLDIRLAVQKGDRSLDPTSFAKEEIDVTCFSAAKWALWTKGKLEGPQRELDQLKASLILFYTSQKAVMATNKKGRDRWAFQIIGNTKNLRWAEEIYREATQNDGKAAHESMPSEKAQRWERIVEYEKQQLQQKENALRREQRILEQGREAETRAKDDEYRNSIAKAAIKEHEADKKRKEDARRDEEASLRQKLLDAGISEQQISKVLEADSSRLETVLMVNKEDITSVKSSHLFRRIVNQILPSVKEHYQKRQRPESTPEKVYLLCTISLGKGNYILMLNSQTIKSYLGQKGLRFPDFSKQLLYLDKWYMDELLCVCRGIHCSYGPSEIVHLKIVRSRRSIVEVHFVSEISPRSSPEEEPVSEPESEPENARKHFRDRSSKSAAFISSPHQNENITGLDDGDKKPIVQIVELNDRAAGYTVIPKRMIDPVALDALRQTYFSHVSAVALNPEELDRRLTLIEKKRLDDPAGQSPERADPRPNYNISESDRSSDDATPDRKTSRWRSRIRRQSHTPFPEGEGHRYDEPRSISPEEAPSTESQLVIRRRSNSRQSPHRRNLAHNKRRTDDVQIPSRSGWSYQGNELIASEYGKGHLVQHQNRTPTEAEGGRAATRHQIRLPNGEPSLLPRSILSTSQQRDPRAAAYERRVEFLDEDRTDEDIINKQLALYDPELAKRNAEEAEMRTPTDNSLGDYGPLVEEPSSVPKNDDKDSRVQVETEPRDGLEYQGSVPNPKPSNNHEYESLSNGATEHDVVDSFPSQAGVSKLLTPLAHLLYIPTCVLTSLVLSRIKSPRIPKISRSATVEDMNEDSNGNR